MLMLIVPQYRALRCDDDHCAGSNGRIAHDAMLAAMNEPATRSAAHPRWSLVVAVLGSAMAFIDSTVVNVALPIMQRSLALSAAQAQWVVESYALLLASMVLVGGALGEQLGRRRVFVAGVVLFAVASPACGLAPSANALIAARAIQGLGAALLVPGSLALISAAYRDKKARGAAIGTWSASTTITAALGPVAGGWLATHASWRWLFLLNLPIALAVVVLASVRVEETRDTHAPHAIDWLGAALVTTGLGAIVFALIDATSMRRSAPLVAVGALLLVAFVVVESRKSAPMVPLRLFRSRVFAGTNVLTLLLYGALGGALYFLPFVLIQSRRYSAAEAGAAFLPATILIAAMSRATGTLAAKHGARFPLAIGAALGAVGFFSLGVPFSHGTYARDVLPGVLALGLGMGLTVAPLTSAVMGSVSTQHAGVASGINNAVSRTGALLSVAALGLVMRTRFDRALDAALVRFDLAPNARVLVDAQRSRLGGASFEGIDAALASGLDRAFDGAFESGFRVVMVTCAVLAALSSLAALAWLGGRRE